MNAFFGSLKSDLFDRRLTPLLALLGAALLAAIVYAAIGGGSSSPPPAASAPVALPKTSGIAVSAVANTKTPAAETTSGAAQQTGGGAARNPFNPLPGAQSAPAPAASGNGAKTSAGASAKGGASSGGSSSGSEGPSTAGSGSQGSGSQGSSSGGTGSESNSQSGGAQKKKAAKAYKVSVLFGTAPAGTPVLSAGLTPYEDLKRQQPLPSATHPLIVFRGVVAGGKSATFTLVGEAILRGGAACLPSASQCQAIDLKEGDTEELEYVPLGGTAIVYELHVVKIEPIKAKAARAATAAKATGIPEGTGGESKAGLQILREYGLVAVPGLRYSRDGSVLVFRGAGHAFARARASAWAAASKR